ncbi:hypothetical protein QUF74_02970 [Candidatus Halobeggiatoa sp. HSG11]|nr:hypothetical protein [Candidatus Halobeggiatoa sp. HSG11]
MLKNILKNSLLVLVSLSAWASQPQDIPLSLQSWVDWVTTDISDCPVHYNQSNDVQTCYWPSNLVLDIKPNQAKFSQQWHIYKDGWIELPGNAKHWPQNVKINDEDAVVADRNNVPSLFVSKGKLNIQGEFNWQRRPDYLPIPINTGLISLTINNSPITIPQFDTKGRLWLTKTGAYAGKSSEENRLDIRVYRHIVDDIPLKINTRIELDVSGRHREVVLGTVMLAHQKAMFLNSSLPTRLETDGHLRIQVRPGSWVLNLQTRQLGKVDKITKNSAKAQWVDTEIWTFESKRDLRLVEITDVTAIDPQQTLLPKEWRKFPAYQVRNGETLQFIEKRRGNPDPIPDQLTLKRHFWLDFDGEGYSVQDHITGTMTRGWRLEMEEPAILGRVAVNGKDQFITRLEENSNTGVEVRRGQIDLIADSRLENELSQLPAIGWDHDFKKVSAVLHLPPGWRLWGATGVDYIPSTWLKRWTLLDLFIVLIMAVAVSKLWHWRWGVLTLVTMILIYHETKAPHWVWLHIIVSLALLKVLPSLGNFTRFIRLYRDISLIGLLIIVLPFMMQQVRQSIYPQLERAHTNLEQNQSYPQAPVAKSAREEVQMASKGAMLKDNLELSSSSYYQQKSRKKLLQIDPNAQVQTGPGLPKWKWRDINMRWSGPVQQNQSVQLWLLSPTTNSILGVIRVMLLTILTIFFLWIAWGAKTKFKFNFRRFGSMAVLILMAGLLLPMTSQAEDYTDEVGNLLTGMEEDISEEQEEEEMTEIFDKSNSVSGDSNKSDKVKGVVINDFPPQFILDELRKRLSKPPECLPYCASLPRLSLELQPAQLNIRMEIHSLTNTAIPLPGTAKQWLPEQVWINGKSAKGLLRDNQGQLWLDVEQGIHQIQITGTLPKRNTIQLSLPLKPRSVTVTTNNGWKIEGLHENGVVDKQLQFTREQDDNLAELEMGELPPFIQIERTLLLGLEWQILTRIVRKTLGSAIVLEVPLLKGESVTSEGIRLANGKAKINLSPNQREISWNSIFDKQEEITLIAADNDFSNEVWRLDASAIWHVEIEGIPVIHHQNEGRWLPEWRPWPNEKITLHLSRPEGVGGQVMTIDRSELIINPGQRTTDNLLSLDLRSSRGMQHKLTLPEDSILQLVKINDVVQPVRQDGNSVTLPINPGSQKIELRYQQSIGMANNFKTSQVDLGIDSVNTNIKINMPSERWILFTGGGLVGPAVMVWGFLIVIALAAVGLGRVTLTPLNTLHWLLLGVVLSQVHVVALLTVVGWFMALGLRQKMTQENASIWKFNLTQISLILLTLITVGIMLAAIEQGLLGHPDMHIAGNGSSADYLKWYEDRTEGILPQVWVFSLSMWVYRIAMLLWALWLSFALVRWFRWGWECFSSDGLWKESSKKIRFRESAPIKNQ